MVSSKLKMHEEDYSTEIGAMKVVNERIENIVGKKRL